MAEYVAVLRTQRHVCKGHILKFHGPKTQRTVAAKVRGYVKRSLQGKNVFVPSKTCLRASLCRASEMGHSVRSKSQYVFSQPSKDGIL